MNAVQLPGFQCSTTYYGVLHIKINIFDFHISYIDSNYLFDEFKMSY